VTFRKKGWSHHVLGNNGLFVLTVRTHSRFGRDVICDRRVYGSGSAPWIRLVEDATDYPTTQAAKAAALHGVETELRDLEAALLKEADLTTAGVRILAAMYANDFAIRGEKLIQAAEAARAAASGT